MIGDNTIYSVGTRDPSPHYETLRKWNGTAWQIIPIPFGQFHYFTHAVPVAGQLYVSCSTADTLTHPTSYTTRFLSYDGTLWNPISYPVHYPISPFSFHDQLMITGGFPDICGAPLTHIARLCTSGDCATITGNARRDDDRDCATRDGEPPLPGRLIEIQPGPSYALTDADGNYRMSAFPGTYSVSLVPRLYRDQVCPAGNAPHTVAAPVAGLYDGNDFGEFARPNMHDVRVSLVQGIVRAGRPTSLTFMVENVGTGTEDQVAVVLTLDDRLSFVSASTTPASVLNTTIMWQLSALQVDELRTIVVELAPAPGLQRKDVVCSEVTASVPREATPADNTRRACETVVGSFDPNFVAVAPTGIGELGIITARDSVLDYTIHFQNTGTDTAFVVAVYDTLAPQLDPARLVVGASSHPCTVTFGPGNALIWRFSNINLPDSTTNEPASQGYLTYRIHLRKNLPPGTSVPNRAAIYFDYNAPVPTNTVHNTISESSDVAREIPPHRFSIAPNPARDRLMLSGDLPHGARLTIRSILGETVRTVSAEEIASGVIDIAGLATGEYLLAGEGTEGMRFVVVR